jgi:hypothetical protein
MKCVNKSKLIDDDDDDNDCESNLTYSLTDLSLSDGRSIDWSKEVIL